MASRLRFRTKGHGSQRQVFPLRLGSSGHRRTGDGSTSSPSGLESREIDRHAHWHRKSTSAGLPILQPNEKPVPLKSPPQPPFHYEGGKYRTRAKIVEKMPPHKTYVEPFAGAGNVLLAKPPAQKEVLADADPKIMKVHKGLKAKADVWNMDPSREKWERIHNKPPSQRTAEEQAYLVGHSYGGKIEDKRQNYHDSGKTGKFDTTKLHEREKDAIMLNKDFAQTMRMFDSPDTLHYLDPPYAKTDTRMYSYGGDSPGQEKVTPERVEKVARTMDGRVMISYDNSAPVRRAFSKKPWKVTAYEVKRSMHRGGEGQKTTKEVLITNFDPVKARAAARPFDESRARKELHT